jgi:hypothetical protein
MTWQVRPLLPRIHSLLHEAVCHISRAPPTAQPAGFSAERVFHPLEPDLAPHASSAFSASSASHAFNVSYVAPLLGRTAHTPWNPTPTPHPMVPHLYLYL